MPLDPVLARIPGLAGYLAQGQYNQDQTSQGIQNIAQVGQGQLMAARLQDHFRDQAFRNSITPNDTHDDILNKAYRFLGPDKAASLAQGEQIKNLQLQSNREIAVSRLMQAASQFDRKQGDTESMNAARQGMMRMASLYNYPPELVDQVLGAMGPGRAATPTQPAAQQTQTGLPPGAPTDQISVQGQSPDATFNLQNVPRSQIEQATRTDPGFAANLNSFVSQQGGQGDTPAQPAAPVPAPVAQPPINPTVAPAPLSLIHI